MLTRLEYIEASNKWKHLNISKRKILLKKITSTYNNYVYRAWDYLPAWLKTDIHDAIQRHERANNG